MIGAVIEVRDTFFFLLHASRRPALNGATLSQKKGGGQGLDRHPRPLSARAGFSQGWLG
jgi:hypothetical protein